jgi:predicted ATP-grasp superfamily ATP-dependent carboligase
MRPRGAALLLESGDNPHLLPAVRAFAAGGWRVGLGGRVESSRVRSSRHVTQFHRVPPPEDGLDAFADGINAAVAAGGYHLVFPADDAEVLALSLVRDQLEAEVPYPAHRVVLNAVDKLALTTTALSLGLPVPETVEATDATVAAASLPVFVKPALHWTPGSNAGGRHLPAGICRNGQEVRDLVGEISRGGGRPLLQQPIDGELMAMTAVLDRAGHLLATVQQRTSVLGLRRTSARAETVPVDPGLQQAVHRLLRSLGWFGLANLQFIRPPGGEPHLIDFNARFYGSMALTRAAGVNLPVAWAEACLRSTRTEPAIARTGVRFHALEEDLRRARRERRGGLVRDVAGSLGFAVRATHPTWSLTDPMPGLVTAARVGRLGASALAYRLSETRR